MPSFIFIFPKFYGTQCKNICKTVISGIDQNLNKQRAEFRTSTFSTLYVHFGQIQYFLKVLKTDLTIQ